MHVKPDLLNSFQFQEENRIVVALQNVNSVWKLNKMRIMNEFRIP